MVQALRDVYNKNFVLEKYEAFLNEINTAHQPLQFRMAETPVFVPKKFRDQMLDACEKIIDVILSPDFRGRTHNAIPKNLEVRSDNRLPDFLTFDFGVCEAEQGELEPQLIEMQAFPSMFAYEVLVDDSFQKHFEIPDGYASYLNGLDRDTYLQFLKETILGDHNPENVILLDLFPEQQKTNVDFYCTQEYLGISPVCVTKLIKKEHKLYYTANEKEIPVYRIYNRLIFDELQQQEQWVQDKAKILFEELDVEWAPHPNWFYRVSKYTLPLISHPNIPPTYYLSEMQQIPGDLENYVLKPLFSFAGQGVVIDVTKADLDKITDPENWILQKKVSYAPVIKTPDEPAKAEIRIFYFWRPGDARPVATNNLARLSKGKMIGVRYNKDKTWTGGSFCLFEK